MDQPIATVYVNMGEQLPQPTLLLYSHTCIATTVRNFMQRYDLPEPVFQIMCKQIQLSLEAQGISGFPTFNNYGFSFRNQTLALRPKCNHNSHGSTSKRRKPASKGKDVDSPFQKLLQNDESKSICSKMSSSSMRRIKKKSSSLSGSEKKERFGASLSKTLNKKSGSKGFTSQIRSRHSSKQKIRQFFKFLTKDSQSQILTGKSVSRMAKVSPKLTNTVTKVMKKGKRKDVDERHFLEQTQKLNLTRDIGPYSKSRNRKKVVSP